MSEGPLARATASSHGLRCGLGMLLLLVVSPTRVSATGTGSEVDSRVHALLDHAVAQIQCENAHAAHDAIDAALGRAKAAGNEALLVEARQLSAIVASRDGDWLNALEAFEAAEDISQRRDDLLGTMLAAIGKAQALRNLGHPHAALTVLAHAHARLQAGRQAQAPISVDSLGFFTAIQGLHRGFLESAQPYLRAMQPLVLGIVEILLLRERSQNEGAFRRFEDAVTTLETARKILPFDFVEREIVPDIVSARIEAGQLRAAALEIDRGLDRARASGDPTHEISLLSARAALEEARGRSREAIPMLERQLLLARDLDDPMIEARVHNDLRWQMMSVARFDAAERHYQHARALAERHGLRTLTVTVLSNLSGARRAAGRPREALALLNRAGILARANADAEQTIRVDIGTGTTLLMLGRTADAERILEASARAARVVPDPMLLADALHALGNLYFTRQAFDKALEVQRESIALANELGTGQASAHIALAATLSSSGSFREGAHHLGVAESLVDCNS